MDKFMGWTHGKFFNLDNFWKKYNLHFIKNLVSHEDISLSSQLNLIYLTVPQLKIIDGEIVTYKWNYKPNSLSNRNYIDENGVERGFLDLFFKDYLTSTAGVYYSAYQKNSSLPKEMIRDQIFSTLLYSYFYMQYNIYITPNYRTDNYDEVYKYLHILKEDFDCSIEDIYSFFYDTHRLDYQTIFQRAIVGIGYVLFQHTFKQFLSLIWNKQY